MSQSKLFGKRRVRVSKTSATLVHIILVSQFSILENEADKINKAKVGFSTKKRWVAGNLRVAHWS